MSTNNQDAFVLQRFLSGSSLHHFREWGVTLDNDARVKLKAQSFVQLGDSLGLVHAAAICEEDERYLFLLKKRKRLGCSWKRFRGPKKDTVYASHGRSQNMLATGALMGSSLKSKSKIRNTRP